MATKGKQVHVTPYPPFKFPSKIPCPPGAPNFPSHSVLLLGSTGRSTPPAAAKFQKEVGGFFLHQSPSPACTNSVQDLSLWPLTTIARLPGQRDGCLAGLFTLYLGVGKSITCCGFSPAASGVSCDPYLTPWPGQAPESSSPTLPLHIV